jgi:hypothetical protein
MLARKCRVYRAHVVIRGPVQAQAPHTQKDLAGSRITLISNTYANIVFNVYQNLDVERIMRSISHTDTQKALKTARGGIGQEGAVK